MQASAIPAETPQQTSVLIVGGGPVGLAMALLLDRFQVPFVLVEKNATTTDHPKARGTWSRTMELFRQWGIEDKVRKRGLPNGATGFAFVESVTGREYGRTPREPDLGQTSAWKCTASQDVVEEELLDAVRGTRIGQVLFSTEFVSHRETAESVEVVLRDVASGQERSLTARYLVAADGAGSGVRRAAGIEMQGPAAMATMCNDYWQGDLSHIESAGNVAGYRLGPRADGVPGGTVLNTNGRDKWLTITRIGDEHCTDPRPWTDEEVVRNARSHTGIPNLDVRLINRSIWRVSRQIAARYSSGRVFIVGDAAHRFPPSGGYGMNTGIQDAHNLAWKLALVLRGQAGPALLDSYGLERRPIAIANADFSFGNTMRFRRMEEAFRSGDADRITFWVKDATHHSHSMGLGLGFSYDEGALIPDGTVKQAVRARWYEPSDRPGGRYPHMWLDLSRRHSTLDLFDKHFVLMVGPKADAWREGARQASARLGLPIESFQLESADSRDGLEMGPRGAVLVRPDGHVAMRMPWTPQDPAAALAKAMDGILCREVVA